MLDEFLNLLKEAPPGDVFNPWWEVDFDNDKYNDSYKVRQQNLRSYFSERLERTRFIEGRYALSDTKTTKEAPITRCPERSRLDLAPRSCPSPHQGGAPTGHPNQCGIGQAAWVRAR